MTRREQILERLAVVLATVPGVVEFHRNRVDVPEERRPAIILLDADEAAMDPWIDTQQNTSPLIATLSPEVFIAAPDPNAGTTLNEIRFEVIRVVLQDPILRILCKDGEVRFKGFSTGFGRGRSYEGEGHCQFHFPYIEPPEELSSEAPSSSEALSSELPSSVVSSEAASSELPSSVVSSEAASSAVSSEAASSEITSSDELLHDAESSSDTHLSDAMLSDRNLSDAHLSDAMLSDRNLSDALQSDRDLSDRIHSDMDLSDRNLSDAHLSDAHLSDAHLSDAMLSDRNLSDAHLSDAMLSDRNLSDAHLSDAHLSDAHLSDAHLSDAHLSDAHLSDAHLSDAHLSDAHLSDAHLSDAMLSDRNLSDRHLSDAYLSDRNLSDAHLSDAHLSDAHLSDAHLSDEALSSNQHSDIHLFEQMSSSNYFADLRPYFINAGAVSANPVSSTTNAPALPSGRVTGNLLIAFQANANPHGMTVSAGWTLFDLEPLGASNIGALAYRYVDGNETAPTFSWPGGGGNATANAGVVTQWTHVTVEKPIGALVQTNAAGQLGNQSLSITNQRALSRIIAFSLAPGNVTYSTPSGWENEVTRGGTANVGLLVDSKGADTATYTQVGVGTTTESHLVLFELFGPFSPAESSDRDMSDAHLSDRMLSDRNLSDRNLSDRNLSDRNLSDRFLSDRNLSDRNLSDRFLSDRFLSDRNLSDKLAHDAASSNDLAFTSPAFIQVGTILTSAGNVSAAPTLPASRLGNDILIAVVQTGNVKTIAVGAGWTMLTQEPTGAGAQRLAVAYRYVDGTEAAPSFSWSGSTALTAFVMCYRGASLTAPWGSILQSTSAGNQGLALTTAHARSTVLAISGSPSVVTYTTANASNFTQRVHSAAASRPGVEVDDLATSTTVTNNGAYNQAGVSSQTSSLVLVELRSH